MKLLKLAVIALFTLGTVSNVSAQDENNPYVVGFGVNVVDFSDYPVTTLVGIFYLLYLEFLENLI